MADLKCTTCGGDLSLSLNTEYAVCENCGNINAVDPAEMRRIREIYRDAELKMYGNSEEGLRAAIQQFQAIAYVSEAKAKITYCENCLSERKVTERQRAEKKEVTDKNNGTIGVIILILCVLVLALVAAGVVYILHHLRIGDLSPTVTVIVIGVVAVSAVLLLISKIKK